MPDIIISKEAHNAVRALSTNFKDTSVPLISDPNKVLIAISNSTFEMLEETALKGESFSDTILRMVSRYKTSGRLQ